MNNELFFAQNKPILEDMKSITLRGINSTGSSGNITSFVDQDGKNNGLSGRIIPYTISV